MWEKRHSRAWGIMYLLLLFVLLLSEASCDKLPRNGALDGQWHLRQLDGQDVSRQQVYWLFQLDIMKPSSPRFALPTNIPNTGAMMRFHREGDSLRLTKAYVMNRLEGHDIEVTPELGIDFSRYGIFALPSAYRVVKLTAEEMLLQTAQHTWVFHKF